MFVVRWAKKEAILLQFEEMLTQVFESAGQFIHLKAVHASLLTFICAARNWSVGSLIQVARESVSVLRELGVVKLTIGQEVILHDKEVLEMLHVIIVPFNVNSLHAGSLNVGLRAVISIHRKPINWLIRRACHALMIYAGKVRQTYVITCFVTTNERTKKQTLSCTHSVTTNQRTDKRMLLHAL